jgi:hypothetical protein
MPNFSMTTTATAEYIMATITSSTITSTNIIHIIHEAGPSITTGYHW